MIAQWDTPKADDKKEDYQAKEFEYGREGYYDFPFKNVSGKEIEVLRYATTCDCTSVRACAVSMAQWEKLVAEQSKQPGEPLTYDAAPTWVDLQTDREQGVKLDDKKLVKVEAGEAGVVHVALGRKKSTRAAFEIDADCVLPRGGQRCHALAKPRGSRAGGDGDSL